MRIWEKRYLLALLYVELMPPNYFVKIKRERGLTAYSTRPRWVWVVVLMCSGTGFFLIVLGEGLRQCLSRRGDNILVGLGGLEK